MYIEQMNYRTEYCIFSVLDFVTVRDFLDTDLCVLATLFLI